jgi:dipeptidyl aminopeptidase/acylaminoacyl peptidase
MGQSDNLPRRSFLGIGMDSLTRAQKDDLGIKEGMQVVSVIPTCTGANAGIQPGDVLLGINQTKASSSQTIIAFSRQQPAGVPLEFQILRGNKKITLKSTMGSYPIETYDDLLVAYGSVKVNGSRLRTIVTQPRTGSNFPAILYIQGIGCASVDNALDTANTQTQLVNHLARAGFMVMRVDKMGTGDSEGVPCMDLDFTTEAAGYAGGLKDLASRANVDRNSLYIIGHSLGGVWGPMIAKDFPVKGIVAYGTIGTNYLEYITNSRRTVAHAIGLTAAQTDEYVRDFAKCFGLFFSLDFNKEETLKKCADCSDELRLTEIRSNKFQEQLYNTNIPELWKAYNGNVLTLWGTADFISVQSDHKLIADIVNDSHPGNAQFAVVKDVDHGMGLATSFEQAARIRFGDFNPQVSEAILAWIGKKPITSPTQGGNKIVFPTDASVREVLRMDNVENAYARWAVGNTIVFQSNRDGRWQLYSMQANGMGQKNLSSNSFNDNFVSTSHDGKLIGFVSDRDGNEEIYIMNVDGSGVRRLTNNSARDIHPYFTPDGKRILFNSTRGGGSFEVYSMDINGENVQRLTSTPDEETCARLSPDGKNIVLLAGLVSVANDDVLLLDASGKNPINITKSTAAEGWPTWSADGSKVYYASNATGTFCLYEIDKTGKNRRQLTSVTAPFMDARPEVSPDGKQLLFNRQVRSKNGKNTIAIYIKNL